MDKMLYLDLSKGKTHKKAVPKGLRKNFLGDRGINAKLLWDLMEPNIDCFDHANVLIFGTGPLTGTIAPCNGRSSVTCKGAVTNLYLKTSFGGHWSAELRFAGYSHLVLMGAAKEPVYLWIDDEDVELRNARDLWGQNVRGTNKTLKEELGDESVKIACIGPAGENLVRFANVSCDIYHSASRGGAGAVMGSKNLKAIAVRGTGQIPVEKPQKLYDVAMDIRAALRNDAAAKHLALYGTSGSMPAKNEVYSMAGRNWTIPHVEDPYPISGQGLLDKGYLVRRGGCFGCNIGCFRYAVVRSGPYAGTRTGGLQLVAWSTFGAGIDVYDMEYVIKANDLCDDLGLDQSSSGHAIEWAMECYERGVLSKKDTEGVDLKFGNAEAVINLLPKIARREGKLADILAEGVQRAARRIGKESWKWAACNSKGLPTTRADQRVSKAYALAFAVNPRGADHLHTETIAEWGMTTEAIELVEKITGDKKWASPIYTEYRPEIVIWHEDTYAATESLGLCVFTSTNSYCVNLSNMAEMFAATTGFKMNEKEMQNAGRRILTLEKCFNVREGADRKLDDLSWRMMHEPMPSGPNKGMMNSREELDRMLDQYYALHGWDRETSWPYRETLDSLGLKDVSKQLENMTKLPTQKRLGLKK